MKIIETPIPDLLIIEPKIFGDSRGFFFEAFNLKLHQEFGLNYKFVQDNVSLSKRGTLRGLHFQYGNFAQTKLVSVLKGEVFDVAVDLRPNSTTFKKYYSVYLSEQNHRQFLIPRGFAHGFLVTSDEAIFCYKCDNYYSPENDGGIRYDDPEIAIQWPIINTNFILSSKDENQPLTNQIIHKL